MAFKSNCIFYGAYPSGQLELVRLSPPPNAIDTVPLQLKVIGGIDSHWNAISHLILHLGELGSLFVGHQL